MRFLFTILTLLIAITGCDPVKKVLKHKEQFEKIGNAWSKQNPCVNDTTINYLPGDTVTNVFESSDTVYSEPVILNDTVYVERVVTKTKNVEKLVHDTTEKVVVDSRSLKAVQAQLDESQSYVAKYKDSTWKLLLGLIASALLNIILLIFLVKKK